MPAKIKHNNVNFIGNKYNRLTLISYIGFVKYNSGGHHIYLCKCECGNETKSSYSSLTSGKAKSCGCLRNEATSLRMRKADGINAFNSVFNCYKNAANKRGFIFDLTKDEFKKITQLNCFYCGVSPSNCKSSFYIKYGEYVYNGIDRVDSKKGYIKDNIVPCCEQCNRMKLDYTLEEFLNKILMIYNFNKDKLIK